MEIGDKFTLKSLQKEAEVIGYDETEQMYQVKVNMSETTGFTYLCAEEDLKKDMVENE